MTAEGIGLAIIGEPIDYSPYTFCVEYSNGDRKYIYSSELFSIEPNQGTIFDIGIKNEYYRDNPSDSNNEYIYVTAAYKENGQTVQTHFFMPTYKRNAKYCLVVHTTSTGVEHYQLNQEPYNGSTSLGSGRIFRHEKTMDDEIVLSYINIFESNIPYYINYKPVYYSNSGSDYQEGALVSGYTSSGMHYHHYSQSCDISIIGEVLEIVFLYNIGNSMENKNAQLLASHQTANKIRTSGYENWETLRNGQYFQDDGYPRNTTGTTDIYLGYGYRGNGLRWSDTVYEINDGKFVYNPNNNPAIKELKYYYKRPNNDTLYNTGVRAMILNHVSIPIINVFGEGNDAINRYLFDCFSATSPTPDAEGNYNNKMHGIFAMSLDAIVKNNIYSDDPAFDIEYGTYDVRTMGILGNYMVTLNGNQHMIGTYALGGSLEISQKTNKTNFVTATVVFNNHPTYASLDDYARDIIEAKGWTMVNE